MRSLVCSVILVLSLAAFHRGHGAVLETAFPSTQEDVDNPEDEGMLTIFGTITDEDPPVQDWVKATPQEAVLAEKLREAVEDDDVDSEIARALNVLQSEDMHRFARGVTYNQPYKTADYAPDPSYKEDTYGGNTYTTQQYEIPSYQEPAEEVDYEATSPTYDDVPQEYPEESYTGDYEPKPQPDDSYPPQQPYEADAYPAPEQPYTEEATEAYPDGTYTEETYPTETYDKEETYTDDAYPPEKYPEESYAPETDEKYPDAPYHPDNSYPEQTDTYPEQPAYTDKPAYPPQDTYPATPDYSAQPDYAPEQDYAATPDYTPPEPYPAKEDYAPEAAASYPSNAGRAGMTGSNGKYQTNYKPAPAPKKSYPTPKKQYTPSPPPPKAYTKPTKQYPPGPPPPKAYTQPAGYSGNPCNDQRDQNKCSGYGQTLAWYYDGKAKTCRAYWDMGCKKSKNIFTSREDCTKKCGGDQKADSYYAEAQKRYGLLGPSTCLHPRSAGNGREQYLSWYFDRETLYCKPFVFSGYFGNANRYDSREQCIQICSVHMKTAKAPSYAAPSKDYTPPAKKYPAAPAQKYPAAPAQKYPTAPAQKYPAAPANKYPAAPAQKYPAAPANKYPAAPANKYPAASAQKYPAAPAQKYPAAPAQKYPAAPAQKYQASKYPPKNA